MATLRKESRQDERLLLEREKSVSPSTAFLGLGCVLDYLKRSAAWKCIYDSIKQCVVCAIRLGKSVCRSLSSRTVEIKYRAFISACGKVDYRGKTKVVGSECEVVPFLTINYGHNACIAFGRVSPFPCSHKVVNFLQAVEFATVYGTVADCLRDANLLRS